MAELAGVLVGDYFLLECLARQGMVETYRARPTTRGGYDVILRLFRPEFSDPTSFRQHFAAEVEKVWHCHHECIQPLLEFGTGDDLLYCATLIPGAETLEQYLKRMEQQPEYLLPVPLVVRFVAQLCDALQYAHEQSIVHGNIQPTSILVQDEEDVLLTHFGMKRAYQDGEPLAAHIDEGNAAYIAPEQALGMIRPASDIYALGVLLYRLLSGKLPYDGESASEIAMKHADEPIPPLCALRPELPEALELVVRVALSKTPEARFPSAAALSQALHAALVADITPLVVPATPERRIFVRSRRTQFTWTRATSFLALFVLLFGLIGASLFVFSLPQHMYDTRGWPFWSVIQSEIFGHTSGSNTPTSHSTPTALPGTPPTNGVVPASGSNSAVRVRPIGTTSQTSIAGGTVVVTPPTASTPTQAPGACASGTLSIDGSPNLEPLLQQVSNDYQARCPGMSISLGGDGSRVGLNFLQQDEIDAASSDLTARSTRNLTDQPVAAMLYAIIVNPDVQLSGLSSSEIQAIYHGSITNWSQVGGPDETITVIQHPSNDTTAAIFRAFVLDGQAEHARGLRLKNSWVRAVAQIPGSISYVPLVTIQGASVSVLAIDGASPGTQALLQGIYPFWSVEHLYTEGNATAQFQAYLPFLTTAQEAHVFTHYGAMSVSMLPQNILASHLPGPEI
ncbi:MAG: serine/threonine-protein kinase [Ktedonobacteraceae bacterium]